MYDTVKDYAILFLGSLLLLLSIIFIPEIRRNGWFLLIVIILCVTSAYLGFDKIKRDREKDIKSSGKIDSLYKSLNSLQYLDSSKASKDSIFQKALFEQFKIVRDSFNKPIQINKITNIERVGTLNQY